MHFHRVIVILIQPKFQVSWLFIAFRNTYICQQPRLLLLLIITSVEVGKLSDELFVSLRTQMLCHESLIMTALSETGDYISAFMGSKMQSGSH
jgi:hypothetical protein